MTFEVTVTQDDDVFVTLPQVSVERDDEVIVVLQDDLLPSIVVTLDEETEVIQTVEQGPPGTQGPPGAQGVPGAPGSAGISDAPIDGRTYGRKNANWADVTNASASVLVLDEPPIGAADGSLWYESDTGLLYILYNDGNSRQWVVAPKITSLPDAPADGSYYGRLNSTWFPVAPLTSPAFTGTPTAPTPAAGIHDDTLATTAFVYGAMGNIGAGYAPLNSPVFVGDPRAPTPGAGDNDTSIATTAFVQTAFAAGTAGKEDKVNKGAPNGYAALNSSGLVPASQLPAYVDEVQEYLNLASFPPVGDSSIIYVADDTNKTYRWSGTGYVEISSSPGTTDAVPEGSVNLYYTDARAAAAAPVQSVAGKTGAVSLTKSDVGLANLDNTSDLNKPISTATQSALDLKAPLSSPALTGFPTAPTAPPGTGTTQIATTAFVAAAVASGGSYVEAPVDGAYYGRVNATWGQVAPLADPVFSGNPRAPTPVPGDADTSIATTGFVAAAIAAIPSPTAMTAVNVTYTPTGNIAATNVQAALTEVDVEKVAKAGDTMTGPLTVSMPTSQIILNKTDPAGRSLLIGSHNGHQRWRMSMPVNAETGANGGSDFLIEYCDDDNVTWHNSAYILRSTGNLSVVNAPTGPNDVAHKQYVDAADSALSNAKVAKAGDTMGGMLTTAPSSLSIAAATGGPSNAIQIMGDGGASYITFHRPGSFAAHLGLDTDNQWKVGGWSMGGVAYKLWHEGNFGPGNYVAKTGDTMSGGLSFGSASVTGSDLSRHISLFGGAYGFNVTPATLNLVSNGAATVNVHDSGITVNGTETVTGALTCHNTIQTGGHALANASVFTGYATVGSGIYYFGSGGTKYLQCDGSNYNFSGGNLTINGSLTCGNTLIGTTHIGGGGAGAVQSLLYLDGGSGTAGGGFVTYTRGGAANWHHGHHSAIWGDDSNDFVLYNAAAGMALQVSYASNQVTFGGSAQINGNCTVSGTSTLIGQVNMNALSCAAIITNGNAISCPRINFDANNYIFGGDGTNTFVRTNGALYVQNLGGAPSNINCYSIQMNGGTLNVGAIQTTSSLQLGNSDYGLIYLGNTYSRYIEQNGDRLNIYNMPVYITRDLHIAGYLFADNGNLYLNGGPALIRGGNYTNFYSDDGNIRFTMGNASDQRNNYRNDTHDFMHSNGTEYFTMLYPNATFASYMAVNLGAVWASSQGYKPGGGAWADSSDIRIKNVLGDYEHGLDRILALRPKRFTFKGNDTRDPPSNTAMGGPEDKSVPSVPYANSLHHSVAVAEREFIGLIAQDTEGSMPELVSTMAGYIDGEQVDDIRQIDSTPLIYAMINAIKTLTKRIELLEGQLASRAMR